MKRLLRAIVVEDNDLLRNLYASTLEADEGISTVNAGTLQDAISLCRREPQVVLLVDLGIPGAEGVSAIPSLRREAPGATLVVITGKEELRDKALAAGAHAVIIKSSPESVGDELIRAVRAAVVRHDAELLASPAVAASDKLQESIKAAQTALEESRRPPTNKG